MNKFQLYIIILSVMILSSCYNSDHKKSLTLNDCPIIGEYIVQDKDTLIDLNFASVRDTFDLSLSSMLSSFQIIYLENSDDALTAAGQTSQVFVSDSYILVNSFKAGSTCKLYRRNGDYLGQISSLGQGPDEYNLSVYDCFINEDYDKIYLMEYRASKILVFDLNGQPLKHIPLAYITHKGRFIINEEEKYVIVMCIPFEGSKTSLIWKQDFDGNIISEYPVSNQFVLIPSSYDYEIKESLNTKNIDFYIHNSIPSTDTLYHYDQFRNVLRPVFTIHSPGDEICHFYVELSRFFLVSWYTQLYWNDEMPRFPTILLDKKTLKGCFVNIKLDMIGNIDGPVNLSFNRGYFTAIMEPYMLREQLMNVLKVSSKLSENERVKLKNIYNNIDENGNCVVFVGDLLK